MSSKIVTGEKMSSFVSALIVSMTEDPATLDRFQAELTAQLGVREEVGNRAKEILSKAGDKPIPGLAKVLAHQFASEGKPMEFTSKVQTMLASLTGKGKDQPFGASKGRDGGTYLKSAKVEVSEDDIKEDDTEEVVDSE